MKCQFCRKNRREYTFYKCRRKRRAEDPHMPDLRGGPWIRLSQEKQFREERPACRTRRRRHQENEGGTERRCEHCGRTYAAFSKSAELGCSKCYDSFGEDIAKVLKRIHGNARHLGKSPRRYCTEKVNARRRIRALEGELRVSVEVENYERAARLRDEIADLRKGVEEQ